MKKFVNILVLVVFIELVVSCVRHVKKDFEKKELVPDVVPKAPTKFVSVNYPNGAKVELGNELTPSQTKDEPEANWQMSTSKFYTLVMVDPDVPSRKNPVNREFLHWLKVNIAKNKDGDVLASYVSPAPPKGSGSHRYTFLVYQQPSHVEFKEKFSSQNSRLNFSIAKFAEKHNFGDPMFGNYYCGIEEPNSVQSHVKI